jgi:hypothetical protein
MIGCLAIRIAGAVLDMGSSTIADQVERIEVNLRRTGSDHCAIVGTLEF